MRVLRLHGRRDLRLHDEPLPEPGPGEVLIRVTAVGLCGSDLHWFSEGGIGDAVLTRPLVLGHEFAGVIESGPRTGQRVAVDPAIPCGHCQQCLAGQAHLCRDLRFAGHGSTDGALRTCMAWPERLAETLPDGLSDPEGALLEPLGVALHALELGRLGPAMSAGVYGCGPIGLLLVQLLRMVGAEPIVATDRLPHRVAAAQAMGATQAVSTIDGYVASADEGPGPASGLDVAFEAAGDDAAVESAIQAVRPGGRVVLLGIPADDRTSFSASVARRKGLTIQLCRRMRPGHLSRAIRLAETKRVDLRPLLTGRYPLSDAEAGFAAASERRGLKVVIEPAAG
jgi:L-iditol 2-dehydrogenase